MQRIAQSIHERLEKDPGQAMAIEAVVGLVLDEVNADEVLAAARANSTLKKPEMTH